MDNIIKLAQALGWPIAATVVAIVVLLVVFRVSATKTEFSLGIKDWLKIGAKGQDTTVPTPILEPPTSEESTKGSTAETVAEVTEGESEARRPLSFWTATDSREVKDAFDQFKASETYGSDPEFWESIYVDRRRELSIGDEVRELTQLVDQNPTWVWPLIFLIRRYVNLRDSKSAEESLQLAMARDNPHKKRWVLREGVSLHYRLYGFEKAMAFCREQVNSGCTDLDISAMFNMLAELTEVDDDPFSSVILREISVSFDRDNKGNLFDLAYRYGGQDHLYTLAYERYGRLGTSDKDWPSSPNNMGVAIKHSSNVAGIDFYERALALDSGIAAANLARALANDGYVRRAEVLLEQVQGSDVNSSDFDAVTDARAKVAAARSKVEKEIKRFGEYSRKQDSRYISAIMAAFSYFRHTGLLYSTGTFISQGNEVEIIADHESALCEYKLGDKTYKGRLLLKPLCYEGVVTSGTGLLSSSIRHALVVPVGTDELRVIIWPDTQSMTEDIRVFQALKVERPPELPLDDSDAKGS